MRSSILVTTNWNTTPASSRMRTNSTVPTIPRFVRRQSRLRLVFIVVNPSPTLLWRKASVSSYWERRLRWSGGAPFGSSNLSPHPVSPRAIQLGVGETLRILNAHWTLAEPVHDDYQRHNHDTVNDARRKWVCSRENRRHSNGVREVVGACVEDRSDQYAAA